MGTIRTFIAIDVAPVIKAAAKKQIRHLSQIADGYRWVDPTSMHITLKFLGNVLDREIPELCRTVEDALRGTSIFDIGFRGIGAFPSVDRPRVIWMGIEDWDGAFAKMQKNLDDELSRRLGFQPEKRDFVGHLTLGRAQEQRPYSPDLADMLDSNAETEFGGMEVDQVIVFSSFPDKGGPTYTAMDTIDLIS
jgi:2'-5' RNA ligase